MPWSIDSEKDRIRDSITSFHCWWKWMIKVAREVHRQFKLKEVPLFFAKFLIMTIEED